MSLTPYMECGYYPHVRPGWRIRLVVAWHVLRGREFFPQPAYWYEPLYRLVHGPYGVAAHRAVEKVEREHRAHASTQAMRRQEAVQWALIYAREAGQCGDVQPSALNFLVEWWVALLKGRF